MTAWYRAGTVTATNGSTTVTGALTAWLANAKAGDVWCPDADGRGYEITAINSNTSITIYPAYAGTTGSGKAYGIARFSTSWNSVSEIGVSLAEILAAQPDILAGSGVPSDSLGQDGDVYFRQDIAEYYTKGAGTWILVTALIGPQGPAGPSYQATSTSSVAIGAGAKTFTVQSGRGYSAGQWLRVSNSSSNYMEGTVTSYSSTTLIINVPAGRAIGSGTFTSWNVNIAGDVGPANSLAIGSVTTGAAGSSADATITGTAPSQTLNLTIPRGNTGATGATGPQGATGAAATITVGTVDTVGPDDPATVTNSGTSGAAVFDFEIPKGDPGTPINHRGDYNAGTTYALNDVVLETGSSWVYINATPGAGNAPPTLPTTSNSYWQLLAQAGSNGTGAVDLVNGQSGIVVLDGTDIEAAHTAANYTPAGDGIADHLAAIDAALDNVSSWGDAPTATVASAATADIGAAGGFYVEITGTTTITSFGTTANVWRIVRFSGALTLTHHATTLILPGGENIVTAAGDTATFLSDDSGNWRCSQYQRANGRSVNLGTASQAALLDEDDMVSDSASAVPSQQSVKAFVEASSSNTEFIRYYGTGNFAELLTTIPIETSNGSLNVILSLGPFSCLKGDIIQAASAIEFTNENNYEAQVTHTIVLVTSPTATQGREITEETGTNVRQTTTHHVTISNAGNIEVPADADYWINVCSNSASSAASPGHVMNIEQDVGRLSVVHTRYHALPYEDYVAEAVTFDGTNDYLSAGATPRSMVDGKLGILSFWVKLDASKDGAINTILATDSSTVRFTVYRGSDNKFHIEGRNSAGTRILNMQTVGTYTSADDWIHIGAKWDLANTTGQLYINGASDLDTTLSTIATNSLNADGAGWTGYTIVVRVNAAQLLASGAGVVGVTFAGGSVEGFQISAAYIGHAAAAGDSYDFESTPAQLSFSGSAGVTIAAGGTAKGTASFVIDPAKALLISYNIASNSNDTLRQLAALTGWTTYYKGAAAEASTVNKSGYSTATPAVLGVSEIDLAPQFNNDTIDYTRGNFYIGALGDGSGKLAGDLAEFYAHLNPFRTSTIDLSVSGTREYWRGGDGKPRHIGDFGASTRGPDDAVTNAMPIIYLRGPAAAFATNRGKGGAFSVTGALTDASTSPSD